MPNVDPYGPRYIPEPGEEYLYNHVHGAGGRFSSAPAGDTGTSGGVSHNPGSPEDAGRGFSVSSFPDMPKVWTDLEGAQTTQATGTVRRRWTKKLMDGDAKISFGALDFLVEKRAEEIRSGLTGTAQQQAKSAADYRIRQLGGTTDSSGKYTPRKFGG